MTYVTGGDVVAKRTPWRVSIVSDFFWGVVNFIGLLYVAPSRALLLPLLPRGRTRTNERIRVRIAWLRDAMTT